MKRSALAALVLVSIAGCDKDNPIDTCNTTYSYSNDVYGDSGLMLKSTKDEVAYISFAEMEKVYRDVEMCVVNTKTPGPIVDYRDFKQMGLGGAWGIYAAGLGVFINTDEANGVQRNCHSDRETLKHEFVHHILYMNGQDWKHSNPAFVQCDALGVGVCDGVACSND